MRVVISRHTHSLPLTPNAPAHLRRAHNPRDFTPHATPAVRCSGLLATHPRHFARTYLWQSFPNLRHDGTNIDQAITRYHHREDPDAQPTKILLEPDAAIDREQYVEAFRGPPQQLAVLKTRPTFFLNRPDLVVAKVGLQTARDALIEEDTQSQAALPSPARGRSPPARGLRRENLSGTHRGNHHLQGSRAALGKELASPRTRGYRPGSLGRYGLRAGQRSWYTPIQMPASITQLAGVANAPHQARRANAPPGGCHPPTPPPPPACGCLTAGPPTQLTPARPLRWG